MSEDLARAVYHITNHEGDIAEATTDPDHARILALDLETQYSEPFTIEKVRESRVLKRY